MTRFSMRLRDLSLLWVAAVMAVSASGCGESNTPKRSVVDHELWVQTDSVSPHFYPMVEDDACFPELGLGTETLGGELVYAVQTDYCDYVTVEQPSLTAIEKGETIYLRFWHAALAAPTPGTTAHVVVVIDGELLWAETFNIPAEGGLSVVSESAARDIPAGAPILFHVDNHGDNEYALIELSVSSL